MAEAVVSSVVQTLSRLLTEEAKFLCGVKDQVSDLKTHLKRLQCFLKDADAIQMKNNSVQNCVAETRELAYSAENALRAFLYDVQYRRGGRRGAFLNILRRGVCILNEVVALHKVGSDVKKIKIKIAEFTRTLEDHGIRSVSEGDRSTGLSSITGRELELRRTYGHRVEEDFVGFEDDLNKVVARLVNEKNGQATSQAILICGMGGQGKTTLAKKVYHSPVIRRHFQGFAWASVSQQWIKEDILRMILISLVPKAERDEVRRMADAELVQLLYDVQKEKKCLVVLDDVWSSHVWDAIKDAFPNEENVGSKLLFTSRKRDVASTVNESSIHELKSLSDEESWQLFEKKAFPKSTGTNLNIDGDKKKLGRQMVQHCKGLPLAIVVLGGLLNGKRTLVEWERVGRNVGSYLKEGKVIEEEQGIVMQVLAYSYQDLPYELKPCFLYLGLYPEDIKIELEQLYHLWIAEGFVSPDKIIREETSMDVAQCYMEKLVQRCMVQLQPNEYTGRFEYCQIHDLMREMCLLKIKEENFLEFVDLRLEENTLLSSSSMETSSSLSTAFGSSKIHRLAFNCDDKGSKYFPFFVKSRALNWDDKGNKYFSFFVKLRERSPYVRSLVLFGNECSFDPCMYSLMRELKFLTTLHLEGVSADLGKRLFQKVIRKLVLLRYLCCRNCWITEIPSSISKLKYLQTLDLRLFEHNMLLPLEPVNMPNVLWKMEYLKHLYLPLSVQTEGKLRLEGLVNLETLENFDSNTCDIHDLCKLSNLRQLKKAHVCKENGEIINLCNNITSANKRSPPVLLEDSSITFRECNFSSEEELNLLRQLLMGHHFNDVTIVGPIKEMPILSHDQISSSNLTSLCLVLSKLEKDPMPMLGKLPNLTKIALSCDCFLGEEMVCSAEGFPYLKYLELYCLRELEEWKLEEGAMPSLSSLKILGCKKLKMIPDGLRFVTTLKELEIGSMPKEFKNRLKVRDGREGEDFHKVRHIPSLEIW